MRFFQFTEGGRIGVGLAQADTLRGLLETDSTYPGSLDSLVRQGASALSEAASTLRKGGVRKAEEIAFLPPLRTPGKVICVGLNYKDHSAESGFEQPDYPTLFSRFTSSLIGHGAAMVRPRASDTLDFEGEMVAVVGKAGRHISNASALSHVIGYSVFNDGSIREYQFKAPQWTVGKNFDDTGAFGPFFVTADELPSGGKGLQIETRLNGAVVQSSNTDNLVFDVATLITVISEAISLSPGDIIITGTPSGVGHARSPKLYMKPGDICEVEIEKLGILRNPIVDEATVARAVA